MRKRDGGDAPPVGICLLMPIDGGAVKPFTGRIRGRSLVAADDPRR